MSKDPVSKTKDVRAAVDAELGFDPLVDAADITVRNIAGDVTLTGTVPSYPQYLEAAAAARRVAGVTGVHNNLMVVLLEGDYRDGGLIVVTFDEGSDSAACCGEASGFSADHPNVPLSGKNGPGGGRIGAVLLSPLIKPGTVSTVDYNHYSLLRTVEDIFGLPHLGDAAMPQVRSFGPDVFG